MGREPEFDIVSYGRRGPGSPNRFSPAQVAQIARTVLRSPEVMVKVSGGGNSTNAVSAHFAYINRRGELDIETDSGERLQGKAVAKELVDDWDLDLDAALDRWRRVERGGPVAQPKLVHNIVLSMPAGTPPQRLLAASREFAREEFALQHRYAIVLHTDQAHPHVHLVVSAHKLDGGRLNIRKADLSRWREQFARQLRAQGLEANATPAQIRGRLSNRPCDGRDRAIQRGVAWRVPVPLGVTVRAAETARTVQKGWLHTATTLEQQGLRSLAAEVSGFLRSQEIPNSRLAKAVVQDQKVLADRDPKKLELTR